MPRPRNACLIAGIRTRQLGTALKGDIFPDYMSFATETLFVLYSTVRVLSRQSLLLSRLHPPGLVLYFANPTHRGSVHVTTTYMY